MNDNTVSADDLVDSIVTDLTIDPATVFDVVARSIGVGQKRYLTTIDPTLAQQMLDRYTDRRRRLSDQHVAELAHRLKHPDPEDDVMGEVRFGPDGKTVAGQHLLHAIITTGIPTLTWIIVNVAPPWQFNLTNSIEDQIAQAIGDPFAVVDRKDGETVTRWATRAVMAVLTRPGHCGCPGGYDLTPPPYRYVVNHTDECDARRSTGGDTR